LLYESIADRTVILGTVYGKAESIGPLFAVIYSVFEAKIHDRTDSLAMKKILVLKEKSAQGHRSRKG